MAWISTGFSQKSECQRQPPDAPEPTERWRDGAVMGPDRQSVEFGAHGRRAFL